MMAQQLSQQVGEFSAQRLKAWQSWHAGQVRAAQALLDEQNDLLSAARQAAAQGQFSLARALLPGTGGLLDSVDAAQVLGVPELPTSPDVSGASISEQEVATRYLSAILLRLNDPMHGAPLAPQAESNAPNLPLPLPPLAKLTWPKNDGPSHPSQDADLWLSAVEYALSSAQQQQQRRVTLAVGSWGEWLDARRVLQARYGDAVGDLHSAVAVVTLEDVVGVLSAAWRWNLPDLANLLSGPLLLSGVGKLAPASRDIVTQLIKAYAQVVGNGILLLSEATELEQTATLGMQPKALPELAWPVPKNAVSTSSQIGALVGPTLTPEAELSLLQLAQRVSEETSDTLVVLPTRGSAARLAAMLGGSFLFSSSLCPVHLGVIAQDVLAARQRGERVMVVATTLPPSFVGSFEQVWHAEAPLPHLIEAWRLCKQTFTCLRLTDVAPSSDSQRHLYLTRQVLRGHTPPSALPAYVAALAQQAPPETSATMLDYRDHFDYASLAAALRVRPATSLPALIAYDVPGQTLRDHVRERTYLPTSALRYAAWLTPTEAASALRRGEAESLGWALRWTGPYDRRYGLASKLVDETQYDYQK